MPETSAERQLDGFLDKYSPAVRDLARRILARMRKRLPRAWRLVYDNYNALAIGFGPSDRASEAIFSIAVYPRWVSLFFLQGASLDDPAGILRGSGRQVRHVVLASEQTLDDPEILAMMERALDRAGRPFDRATRGQLVIKSVSAKQRPRRPG